jgi:hypothetical protein
VTVETLLLVIAARRAKVLVRINLPSRSKLAPEEAENRYQAPFDGER